MTLMTSSWSRPSFQVGATVCVAGGVGQCSRHAAGTHVSVVADLCPFMGPQMGFWELLHQVTLATESMPSCQWLMGVVWARPARFPSLVALSTPLACVAVSRL